MFFFCFHTLFLYHFCQHYTTLSLCVVLNVPFSFNTFLLVKILNDIDQPGKHYVTLGKHQLSFFFFLLCFENGGGMYDFIKP